MHVVRFANTHPGKEKRMEKITLGNEIPVFYLRAATSLFDLIKFISWDNAVMEGKNILW